MKLKLKISENESSVENNNTYLWKQILVIGLSSLISVLSGFTIGISAMMLPQLRNDTSIHYDPAQESWIASISVMSMVIGSLGSGPILDRYGRKLAHVFISIPLIIGWIIIACANSTSIILVGRFITGLTAGANKPVTLVYIGEISDPRIRSVTLCIPGLMTPAGVWISHIIGYYCRWRISAIIFAVVSTVSLLGCYFFKESPLWLISKGRTAEGIDNFRWLRGINEKSEVELKSVLEKQANKTKLSIAKETLQVISSASFLKPMLVLTVVMFNVQISGVNSLSFYSQDVFDKVFSGDIDPFTMTMAMDGIRNLISLIICAIGNLVPRKLTYLISNFGGSLFCYGLVICFETTFDDGNWASVIFLLMFVICASIGMVTGFAYVPELLPTSARGLGSSLNSTLSYIILFIIVKIVPDIINAFDVTGLFIYFGTGTLFSGIALCFMLPETNGKTLQSIEDSYNK